MQSAKDILQAFPDKLKMFELRNAESGFLFEYFILPQCEHAHSGSCQKAYPARYRRIEISVFVWAIERKTHIYQKQCYRDDRK